MATSRSVVDAPGRLIFALMIFTMAFSIVGEEIGSSSGKKPTLNPFLIIFGGTTATAFLTLLTHAGEAGETLGVGLATVAFTSSTLVYGKPVWDALNKAFGSKPTTPVGRTTPTTSPTATASALAQTIPIA